MERSTGIVTSQGQSPLTKEWKDTLAGYAFTLPFLILFAIFTLYPIVQGFWISLHNFLTYVMPRHVKRQRFKKFRQR